MAGNSVLGFTGEYCDPVMGGYPLGNGYRTHLPGLMRFSAPDSASPFDAGGINPYIYCGGDPVNRTDPTGHFFLTSFLGQIAKDLFSPEHNFWLNLAKQELIAFGTALPFAALDPFGSGMSVLLATVGNVAEDTGHEDFASKFNDITTWVSMGLDPAVAFYKGGKVAAEAGEEEATSLLKSGEKKASKAEVPRAEERAAKESSKKTAESGTEAPAVPHPFNWKGAAKEGGIALALQGGTYGLMKYSEYHPAFGMDVSAAMTLFSGASLVKMGAGAGYRWLTAPETTSVERTVSKAASATQKTTTKVDAERLERLISYPRRSTI